jgi:hypothetical protein
MRAQKIKQGDTITFKAATRSDFKTVSRKVVGVDSFGRPMVRYHGYSHFVVLWREVSQVVQS